MTDEIKSKPKRFALGKIIGYLKWPAGILILGFIIYKNQDVFKNFSSKDIHWGYLSIAFILCITAIILTFVRWYILVRVLGFSFRMKDALRLGFVSYAFNYIMPGSAGGDIVKATMIASENKSRKSAAASTVIMDRLLGMHALFIAGAIASLFQIQIIMRSSELKAICIFLWCGAIGGAIGIWMTLHPAFLQSRFVQFFTKIKKVGHIVEELISVLEQYRGQSRSLFFVLFLSLIGHFKMLACFYFCSLSMGQAGIAPGFWMHLVIIPGAELAGVIIPTPGGLGVLEGAIVIVYQYAAMATDPTLSKEVVSSAGVLTGLAFRAISISIAIIGVIYYMAQRKQYDEAIAEQENE